MATIQDGEIHISLATLDQFFSEPTADPFDPNSRYVSGIDELVGELLRLNPNQRKMVTRLVVTLQAGTDIAGLEGSLRDALQRYCAAQVDANHRALEDVHRSGRRVLPYSIVAGLLAVVVGLLLALSGLVPDPLLPIVASVVSVFAWVALWQPAQLFLYDWIPYSRDERLYRWLGELDVRVQSGSH
jgi:hypothetical protein